MRIDLAVSGGGVGLASWVKTIAAMVLTIACATASGAGEAPLALVFATPHAEFGERYQHQTVVHVFRVENPSDHPVRIVSVLPRSPEGWVGGLPVDLAPGARAELTVHQPLVEHLGRTGMRVGVYTDERDGFDVGPGSAHYKLSLSGFVQSAYDPETLSIGFGWVDPATGGRAVVELASREVPQLSLLGVRDAPAGAALRDIGAVGLPGEGRRLEISLAAGGALGLQEGRLLLETNVVNQPLMVLRYWANVFGDVRPDRNPLKLSGGRVFETVTESLELRSRSQTPFHIVAVEDPAGLFEWLGEEPCADTEGACRRLLLRAQPTATGPVVGSLEIRLQGQSSPLPVAYRGWVLPAGVEIRQIDATAPIKEAVSDGQD